MKKLLILFLLISLQTYAGENKLTSTYTDFSKDCKGDPAVKEGDVPQICKGPAGYTVTITYSACFEYLTIESADRKESLTLPEQKIGSSDKRKLEWRLLNKKPAGIIYRVFTYKEDESDPCGKKKTGESLEVRGLGKYSSLSESIKSQNKANEKAREVLDSYLKK